MQKIKTALLSYGMSGKVFHAPFVNFHSGLELIGSWERSKKLIQQDFPEVKSYATIDELLEDTVMGSLSSGYIARAADVMPKQGKHAPWRVTNNYLEDRKTLKQASFEDGILKFKQAVPAQQRKPKLVS